jgi:hypothetical protein
MGVCHDTVVVLLDVVYDITIQQVKQTGQKPAIVLELLDFHLVRAWTHAMMM